jgi:hypothetical protein
MALDVALLLSPFIVASDIFMLKKDSAKLHCTNAWFNIPHNAPLAVYQATLGEHWFVMGFKTNNSPI